MTCKTCIHWEAMSADPMNLGAPRAGVCLRYPPVPFPISPQQTMNVFPQTMEGQRCGEYQEKPTKNPLVEC